MWGWGNLSDHVPIAALPCPRCQRKRPEMNTALAICRCWWCGLVFTVAELETGRLGPIKDREEMGRIAFPK